MGGDVGQFWLYFNEEVSLKPGAFQRGGGSSADYFDLVSAGPLNMTVVELRYPNDA